MWPSRETHTKMSESERGGWESVREEKEKEKERKRREE